MKTNQNNSERIIRILLGIGILSMLFIGPRSDWGYLGIIPLATGVVGWCPMYHFLSLSTKHLE